MREDDFEFRAFVQIYEALQTAFACKVGIGYSTRANLAREIREDAQREAVVHAHPRTRQFKEDIIQAFYDGIKHKPDTTFGNVKADVLADKDPGFRRGNFCSVIRGSAWRG